MTNSVKVKKYFWVPIIATNNFAFEVKAILGLESIIQEGRLASRTEKLEKLGV